jgi:omega-amidase
MHNLKVALVQSSSVWEDVAANLMNFDKKLEAIAPTTDLVLLPEMFNTGFSINPLKIAEKPDGVTFVWLKEKANYLNCVVAGSVLTEEAGKYYNRLYWMRPDGTYEIYNKRHLFRLGEEFKVFTPGKERKIVELKGWKILPIVCYDLRFPVWIKNRYNNGQYEYDLIACVSSWPAARQYAWRSLLIARAIENQACMAGVNRVGIDGEGKPHTGYSVIADALGSVIAQAEPDTEQIITATLNWDELQNFRKQFTIGLDWDEFEIKIDM